MDVGDDQRTHVVNREFDLVARGFVAAGGFGALEQAAIDQDRVVRIQLQPVAAAGGAVDGAVVEDVQGFAALVRCRAELAPLPFPSSGAWIWLRSRASSALPRSEDASRLQAA